MPRAPRVPKTDRKELTPNQRAEILGAHKMGKLPAEIASRFGYKLNTVCNTIDRAPERDENKSQPRGRPRATLPEMDQALAECAVVAPGIPLQELSHNLAPNIGKRTVQRRLREKDIGKFRQRKKPLLTGAHRQKRLTWALAHEHWTEEDWQNMVWTDECSIELGSGKSRPYMFRVRGQGFQDTDAQEAVPKGPRVMIWAAFYGSTKSEAVVLKGDPTSARGGVTAQRYLDCIKEHLPPLMEGENKVFMQDGASVHTAHIVRDWLAEKGYQVMEWPPYSPDLNPIEHLWFPMKAGVHPLTSTIQELVGEDAQKQLLGGEAVHAWSQIPAWKLEKLIKSMPTRVRKVIEAGGGHTKY